MHDFRSHDDEFSVKNIVKATISEMNAERLKGLLVLPSNNFFRVHDFLLRAQPFLLNTKHRISILFFHYAQLGKSWLVKFKLGTH
jgi:hypothetical protein